MLLPVSSGQGGDATIARSLENAARLRGDGTDRSDGRDHGLRHGRPVGAGRRCSPARPYRKGPMSSSDRCARMRRQPSAWRVANSNVNVLSFSNNTEIAGGNVFVLGHTFPEHCGAGRVLRRLPGAQPDRPSPMPRTSQARWPAMPVLRAAQASSATVVATIPYEFSQNGRHQHRAADRCRRWRSNDAKRA